MSEREPFEALAGEWRYGECIDMQGCAWSQRGLDPATWEHHPSLGAARVRAYAEARAELAAHRVEAHTDG